MDKFTEHQSKAGKVGGRSRSAAKVAASRANLAKVRARRHNPVTGPQPVQPHDNVNDPKVEDEPQSSSS